MALGSALIFGGTRGIGAACVETMERDGWQVSHTYAHAPGKRTGGIRADIRLPEEVVGAFDAAQAHAGSPPHCVVINAGINVRGRPVDCFPADDLRALLETNVMGAFNVLQAAAQRVADGGVIIGLTTSLVRLPLPGAGAYTASKAAVEALLRSAQRELAPRGIRVNGVAPGPVDTDLFRAGKDAATVARMAALSPFNRVGTPAEVAEVVAFLASDRASWIAGQIVQPNGGLV